MFKGKHLGGFQNTIKYWIDFYGIYWMDEFRQLEQEVEVQVYEDTFTG